MAYLPKSTVIKNIVVRSRKDKNGEPRTDYEAYFGVDPFPPRKTVRISRSDRDALLAAIDDFYKRHKVGGDAAARLSALQALDAKNALDALAAAKIKLPLYEVVNAYINGITNASAPGPEGEVKASTAFDEYYGAKPDGWDKHTTMSTAGKWVRTLGDRTLASVTAKEIVDYLNDNYGDKKPKTFNQVMLYIKTFLNWCCKEERNYIARNPIRTVKFKPVPWEEPEYMKPDDVKKLFELLWSCKDRHPEWLAYAIVSFFCGCRRIEIVRMASDPDAAKIDIEGATVRIAKAKGFQRGKRPRAFNIHPTALAWMRAFDFLGALKKVEDGTTGGTPQQIYCYARDNGVQVFKNAGRHTFITYHVAAYGDPSKTTAMVGTSERMRADNYCGLAKKADGEAYFNILPPNA